MIGAGLLTLHSVSEASMLPPRTQALIAPLVADKGKFKILVNGQQVGKEEFAIAPNGSRLDRPRQRGNSIAAGHHPRHRQLWRIHPDGAPGALRMVHARREESFRHDRLQRRHRHRGAPPRGRAPFHPAIHLHISAGRRPRQQPLPPIRRSSRASTIGIRKARKLSPSSSRRK